MGNLPLNAVEEIKQREKVNALVVPLIMRDKIALVNGVICKFYRNKWVELWPIEQTPIIYNRIVLDEPLADSKQLYHVSINGEENIITHYQLKKGMYTDMFSTLSGTLDERSFKQYANVIDALSKLPDVPVQYGKIRLGIYKDKDTNTYFRILPNGKVRGFDSDKYMYYSPEQEESFTKEQWEERLNYKEVSKEQQIIDYDYFKKMIHDNIALLDIVHNIGTMLGWIKGNGYKHGNALYWLAEQGTGKTWLSRIGISTMYPYSEEFNGHANFEGTYASIVNVFCKLDYTPSFLDDAHLQDSDKKNTDKIMNTFTRKVFNGDSVRAKSLRSGDINATNKYIHTNFMITSENLDNIESSTRTRSLIVPLNPSLIDRSSDGKYSLLKTYEHIISVYQWGDSMDNYILNYVNQYGYDVMLNKMREKYVQYREEILQNIKKRWLMIFNKNTSQSIDRMSFIGAYYYVIADLMQDVLNLPFFTDIKQIVLDIIYNQLRYVDIGIEVNKSENSINPALDGIFELLEAILAGIAINNNHYNIEPLDKTKASYNIKFYPNSDIILYEFENFFLFPSAHTNLWLNTMTVKAINFNNNNDIYKKRYLAEMLDNANFLFRKDENENRYDIKVRIGQKTIRGLALRKEVILTHFPSVYNSTGNTGNTGNTALEAGLNVPSNGNDGNIEDVIMSLPELA